MRPSPLQGHSRTGALSCGVLLPPQAPRHVSLLRTPSLHTSSRPAPKVTGRWPRGPGQRVLSAVTRQLAANQAKWAPCSRQPVGPWETGLGEPGANRLGVGAGAASRCLWASGSRWSGDSGDCDLAREGSGQWGAGQEAKDEGVTPPLPLPLATLHSPPLPSPFLKNRDRPQWPQCRLEGRRSRREGRLRWLGVLGRQVKVTAKYRNLSTTGPGSATANTDPSLHPQMLPRKLRCCPCRGGPRWP